MCSHDKFRYFDHDLLLNDEQQIYRVLSVRVCVGCHEPEILVDSGWLPMKEVPCPTP
jgi:hypothetical protein